MNVASQFACALVASNGEPPRNKLLERLKALYQRLRGVKW